MFYLWCVRNYISAIDEDTASSLKASALPEFQGIVGTVRAKERAGIFPHAPPAPRGADMIKNDGRIALFTTDFFHIPAHIEGKGSRLPIRQDQTHFRYHSYINHRSTKDHLFWLPGIYKERLHQLEVLAPIVAIPAE